MHAPTGHPSPTRFALAALAAAALLALALAGPASAATHTLSVEKAGSGTGTVTSSPAGIECGSACSAGFEHGTVITLSGSPGANTQAPQWSGCNSVTAEGRCVVSLTTARTVTATFEPSLQLTLSKAGAGAALASVTSSPAGIQCGSICQAPYNQGATVTLSAPALAHLLPVQWSGCDSEPSPTECKLAMSSARSVTATFDLQPGYALDTVTVEKTGTGQGTVSGSPGSISCGPVCSAQLIAGTKAATGTPLTLTASPSPGSVFAHWSGGGCAGSGPCTTTITSSRTVRAVFTAVGTRTLSVTRAGSGQGAVTAKAFGVECGSACTVQVPAAKKVTLTAKAATGSSFARWGGSCSGTAKTCKVTMTEARQVTATFTAPPAPTPPLASCVVPKLKGKSLRKARRALSSAHCALGKVRKPKARKGHKPGPLVVKSFSPGAGTTLPAAAKVDLRLAKAQKRRRG